MQLPEYSIWSGIYKKRISRKQEKQLQKEKIEQFMTKQTVKEESRIIEELDIEESQITKELSIYTSKPEFQSTENQPDTDCKENKPEVQNKNELSPTLIKNPFLKNRKISKFPKTYTYGNTVVKSRFFCPASPVELKENKHSVQYKSEVETGQSTSRQQTSINCAVPIHCNPVLQPSDSEQLISRKRCSDQLIQTESNDNSTNGPQVEYDEVVTVDSKQVSETLCKNCKFILTNNFKENVKVPETKKRKLGPARRVGLTKVPTSQKTLHSFFGKMKKTD